MLVKNWMTAEVMTVQPDNTMMKALRLMREKDIRRLPVVDENGVLVGIVSDRDLKEASPSKATTLDVHELYYLLSEIKIADIMTKKPLSVHVTDSVEKASVLMTRHRIGGLPVVDDESKVVGIITGTDVFRVLTSITRVEDGGVQMGFSIKREPGEVKIILDELAAFGAKVLSIITVYPQGEPTRQAFIRISEMDDAKLTELEKLMAEKYELVYFVKDVID